MLLGLVLTGGCFTTEEAPPEPAEEVTVSINNAASVLRASRIYGPPTTWEDAERTFEEPTEFVLPELIPVTIGNSGNHKVVFSYQDETGQLVSCEYRGGSREPHPKTPVERALAGAYRFERCSNGTPAGSRQKATWVKLHVVVGDQKDPAGRTEVVMRLGETFPELAPPLSPAESIAIRDAFSWQATQALPEMNAEGLPALHYFLIYLEDREQADALDEMLIHHSPLPLFSDELTRWDGQAGVFNHVGDGTGLFVFAIMPAKTYNLLRQAALDGDVMYRVIQRRAIPQEARGPEGSISYEALRTSGFRYLDQDPPTGDTSTVEQQLFGRILRKVVEAVVGTVKGVVRAVQTGIGVVDRWVTGRVVLSVALDVRNTDPAFGGRIDSNGGPGASTPMQRVWGARAGRQVTLPGVRVTARQWALNGILPTLFSDRTNDAGVASMEVARGRRTSICIATENAAAQITSFVLEKEVCDFRNLPAEKLQARTTYRLYLQHRDFNVLAQATEGRAYLRDVAGFTPRKAEILVGAFANLMPRASAPAFGYPNLSYDAVLIQLAATTALIPKLAWAAPVIVAAWATYAVDIILPEDPMEGYDANFDSRGLVSHEYGHFAFASMLYDEGVENISVAYWDAVVESVSGPSESSAAAYLNEGFADFFARQVSGGTNYYSPPGNYCGLGPSQYCHAAGWWCADANESERSTFEQQVDRIVTILNDAFDGWAPGQDTPGNGRAWSLRNTASLSCSRTQLKFGPYEAAVVNDNDGDEEIKMPGARIRNLFHKWDKRSNRLTEKAFLGALSDTMYESGYTWCQQCKLFVQHDSGWNGTSPAEMANFCNQSSFIRGWIGASPGNTCAPPPPPPPPPPPLADLTVDAVTDCSETCAPASGSSDNRGQKLSLSSGTHQMTVTGGAMNYYGSNVSCGWSWSVQAHVPSTGQTFQLAAPSGPCWPTTHGFYVSRADAEQAASGLSTSFSLAAPAEVIFRVCDSHCSDNAGSLKLQVQ